MRYGKIEGPVFCRYSKTASIINSTAAREVGIKAPLGYKPQYGFRIEAGRTVKLRMMLDDRKRRMTCHARIDWIKEEEESGEYMVGFSELSLTDTEFKLLMSNFTDQEVPRIAFGETVRAENSAAAMLSTASWDSDLVRDKAVTMPVSLIDLIDDKRGDVPFSAFVVAALTDRLGD